MTARRALSPPAKAAGLLWLALGGILGALMLGAASVLFFRGIDTEATFDFCLVLFDGMAWFCIAALGLLFVLGKRWARFCLLVVMAGLTLAGLLNLLTHAHWFHETRPSFFWYSVPVGWTLLPFPWVFNWPVVGLGLMTIGVLVRPGELESHAPSNQPGSHS